MKRVCAVTGAGSGIGFGIAAQFAESMTVLLGGRTQAKIDKAVKILQNKGADAYGMPCDVSDPASVAAFADRAAELGDVCTVVNAAGVSPGSGTDARGIYSINMIGTVNVTNTFKDRLGSGGVLINIASMSAYMFPSSDAFTALCKEYTSKDFLEKALEAFPNAGHAYPISKKFVIEFTKICCPEFAAKGARVVSISPGIVDTPLLNDSKGSDALNDMVERTPLGRMSEPEEYGYLAQFLASEKAGCITGIDILVDGGYMSLFGK